MDRRKFIARTALATAGVAAGTQLLAKAHADVIREYGFQAYTVRDVIYKDMAGTLKSLRKAGYDYMEGFDFGNGKLMGKPIAEAKQIIKKSKLELRSLHVMTGNLNNDWQRSVDDAAELGAKYLVCAYLMPDERKTIDQYKALSELFSKSAEVARKAGIQFCYHNHEFEFQELDDQIPMDVILSETDSYSVKIELDIYWTRFAGVNPIKFFNDNRGRVPLWHVKDLSIAQDNLMTEVGNGVIDWRQIFAHQKDSGMQSFFVEQDRNFAVSSLESLSTSRSYLKKLNF